jgi:hypothetical protein
VSGRDKRLVRGPADPLAIIPSPIAKAGVKVTDGDPPADTVIGGRDGSNPLEGITPSATAIYR